MAGHSAGPARPSKGIVWNEQPKLDRHPCPIERHFHDQGMEPIHSRCLTKFKRNALVKAHLKKDHLCKCVVSGPDAHCRDSRHVTEDTIKSLHDMKRRGPNETNGELWKRIYEIIFPNHVPPSAYIVTPDLLFEILAAPTPEVADIVDAKLGELWTRGTLGSRPSDIFKSQIQEVCELLSHKELKAYHTTAHAGDESLVETEDGVDLMEQCLNL